jgi:hypothetical protein
LGVAWRPISLEIVDQNSSARIKNLSSRKSAEGSSDNRKFLTIPDSGHSGSRLALYSGFHRAFSVEGLLPFGLEIKLESTFLGLPIVAYCLERAFGMDRPSASMACSIINPCTVLRVRGKQAKKHDDWSLLR